MRSFLDNQTSALDKLVPARAAMIAIHWQVDVLQSTGALRLFDETVTAGKIVERAASLIQAGRSAGLQIVYANTLYREDGADIVRNNPVFNSVHSLGAARRGSAGSALAAQFTVDVRDLVVDHTRLSAFYGTPLDALLRDRSIDTVIIFGIATNVAVDTTVRDAIQMGYSVILVEDCCCSSTPEYHDAAMVTLQLLSTEVTTAKNVLQKLSTLK